MAKLTTDQRIKKLNDCIMNEEGNINASKEKIKTWNKALKSLQEEKDKAYAFDFLKILSENGLTTDDDKTEFMLMIEEKLKTEKSTTAHSSSNNLED